MSAVTNLRLPPLLSKVYSSIEGAAASIPD